MLWDQDAQLPPPPRPISGWVKTRFLISSQGTQISFLVISITVLIASQLFTPKAVWYDLCLLLDSFPLTGKITGWTETGIIVDEAQVIANHFTYEVAGTIYEGTSFFTDQGLSEGESVNIKVSGARPSIAVIEGARTAPIASLYFLLFCLIPLSCLSAVFYGVRTRFRRLKLLQSGLEVDGEVLNVESTNISINEELVYEVTMAYTDAHGQHHEFQTRTTDPDELTDEYAETILVDPKHPARALPIDVLPDFFHLKSDGTFKGFSIGTMLIVMMSLILPACCVMAFFLFNTLAS